MTGGPPLTYLLTGTDGPERAIVKEMNLRLIHSPFKNIKLFRRKAKISFKLLVKDSKIAQMLSQIVRHEAA
jgi:hypothetical protein